MESKSTQLSRSYALHGSIAKFRITENSIYSILLVLALYLLVFAALFMALMVLFSVYWKIWLLLFLLCSLTGGILFQFSNERKTTWQIEIDRPKRRFIISRNKKTYPVNKIKLSIINRSMLGYAIWMVIENGPGLFLSGSKSHKVVNELANELTWLLTNYWLFNSTKIHFK